jgi:hypothetical protein
MRRFTLIAVLGALTLGIVGLLPSAAEARYYGRWSYSRPPYVVYYYPPVYRTVDTGTARVPVSTGTTRTTTTTAPARVIELPTYYGTGSYVPPAASDYRTSDSYQYDHR